MRRLLWVFAALVVIAVAVGIGTALGVRWAGLANGVSVSIDGDLVAGSGVAVVLGVVAALGVSIACVVALALLASLVVVVVPLALVCLIGGAALVVVAGLSPVLVPVLLGVGAYVLLSRRARRRSESATPAPTPG